MRLSSSANKTNSFITGSDLLATSKLLSAQKGEETTKRTPEKNESESYVSVKCSFASKDNRHSSFITLTDNHSQSSHMDQSQQRCVSALSCTPAHIHTHTLKSTAASLLSVYKSFLQVGKGFESNTTDCFVLRWVWMHICSPSQCNSLLLHRVEQQESPLKCEVRESHNAGAGRFIMLCPISTSH